MSNSLGPINWRASAPAGRRSFADGVHDHLGGLGASSIDIVMVGIASAVMRLADTVADEATRKNDNASAAQKRRSAEGPAKFMSPLPVAILLPSGHEWMCRKAH